LQLSIAFVPRTRATFSNLLSCLTLLSKDRSGWFTIYLQSMMRVSNALAAAAASLLVGRVVANVDPIVIKGSKFFYSTNGTQL
jgi:hypothetical protein